MQPNNNEPESSSPPQPNTQSPNPPSNIQSPPQQAPLKPYTEPAQPQTTVSATQQAPAGTMPVQAHIEPQSFNPTFITPTVAPSPSATKQPAVAQSQPTTLYAQSESAQPQQPSSQQTPVTAAGGGHFSGPTQIPSSPGMGPMTPVPQPTSGNPDIDLFGKKAKKKKILLASLLSVFFVFGGASAYVFGFYIPNKPENVWKTGITRTGDEFKGFIDKISDTETYVSLAKNKVSVTGEFVNNKDEKVSINYDATFDETKTDSRLDINSDATAGMPALNLQSQFKANIPEDSVFPNIYFNIAGFTDLGVDNFYPGLSKYDGQWISVEQDFFEKYLGDSLAEQNQEEASNVTQEDILAALSDVTDVTVEYLFSNDPEKALLVNQEFVATEESEGIQANRYKAYFNQQNGVKFCQAATDVVFASEAYKKIAAISDDDVEQALKEAKESCDLPEDYNEEEDKVVFDLWVDKNNKIIHKLRFTEDLDKQSEKYKQDKAECVSRYADYDFNGSSGSSDFCSYYDRLIETGEKYVEVGQIYKGGDEITLFVNSISDTNQVKESWRGDIAVNINDLTFNGELTYVVDRDGETAQVNIGMKTEPFDGEIDANKPEGSVPLQQVIDEITQSFNSMYDESFQAQELGANTDQEIPPVEAEPRNRSADWLLNLFGVPTE